MTTVDQFIKEQGSNIRLMTFIKITMDLHKSQDIRQSTL